MAQWIWDAAEKLNYPSAHRIYLHLKAHNQYVPYNIIQEAYSKNEPTRQIFYNPRDIHRARRNLGPKKLMPPNLKQGKVAAADINDRWMADLIDLTAQPSIEEGKSSSSTPYQYILVVLNVFSKQLWARALRTKTAAVVTEAFKEILDGEQPPSRLNTDSGSEFTGPFAQLLEEKDIWHSVKDAQDKNALAPIDRVIGTLKRSIFRRVVADEDPDWASNLQKTVDGYNQTVHSALQGRAPEEVPDEKELQFALRRFNSESMVHNANIIHARDERLVKQGAFRVQDPNRPFARSYQPRYGDEVHEVVHAAGGIVLDAKGNVYKSKHTLAVPSGSENIPDITKGMRGGNALIERKNLEVLEPFKDQIKEYVSTDGKWEFQVAAHMKSLGMTPLLKNGLNYRKALLLLGFKVDEQGRVTHPNIEAASVVRNAPPRRITIERAPVTPAEAAANLRRRITGKRPV